MVLTAFKPDDDGWYTRRVYGRKNGHGIVYEGMHWRRESDDENAN